MAYDPVTGEYKPEDSSVETKMTGLLSRDNEYMKRAAARGKSAANRRGLLNSTMGVQAVEAARIDAAMPIATQDAAQAHERNIQGRNIQIQDIGQRRDIAANRDLLDTEIAGRERLQEGDIASRERMQDRDIAATRERLQMELGNRVTLQDADNAAQKERLGMQLTQQEELALAELRAAEERLGLEIGSRERMQGIDVELQERIASMNIAANERTAAAQIAQAFEASYANIMASIMNNPDIPAAERQRYMDHAARIRDNNLNLVEQFYGIELEWRTSGGGANPTQPRGYIPPEFRGDTRALPYSRYSAQ